MLLKPHYFVGPTHGFDFASKNFPISSVAVLLFLLEIIRKDSKVKMIYFKKALFIMISELLRILNTEWGCELDIFCQRMCAVTCGVLFVTACVRSLFVCGCYLCLCTNSLTVYLCLGMIVCSICECISVCMPTEADLRGAGMCSGGQGWGSQAYRELFVLACLLGMASLSVPIVQQITLPH